MTVAERVKALNLPLGSYAVFGSGPLEAHGIREAKDLDIIVTSELFRKLKEEGSWKLEKLRDIHECLKRDGIGLYDTWAPDSWDIPQMIKEAEMIEGVPFVRLELVLEWKRIRNNPKDAKDIEAIEKYLASRS